jgi:hypothetical protein
VHVIKKDQGEKIKKFEQEIEEKPEIREAGPL